ncbi:hypothetical protein [Lentisalinibacter salinarum]|uniref:hypothetical protein n=1 Tax=Lentisalinibacter salinarum TaxID=2992239 RepID=UPI003870E578
MFASLDLAAQAGSNDPLVWIAALFGPLIAVPVLRRIWEQLLHRQLTIRYGRRQVRALGAIRARRFDPAHIRGFGLHEHPKAKTEAREHEHKIRVPGRTGAPST